MPPEANDNDPSAKGEAGAESRTKFVPGGQDAQHRRAGPRCFTSQKIYYPLASQLDGPPRPNRRPWIAGRLGHRRGSRATLAYMGSSAVAMAGTGTKTSPKNLVVAGDTPAT
jgi:hypothetical protein